MRIRLVRAALAAAGAIAGVALAPLAAAQDVSVELPLGIGLRTPSYDRVNGLSLPFGPRIVFGDQRVVIDPSVTYRSHLGKVDAALGVTANMTGDSSLAVSVVGSRGTFTNDAWIRTNLINSFVTFAEGRDARNYFRGDRAEARLTGRLPGVLDGASLFVGGRAERDWSTGWRLDERRGPYSIIDRSDQVDGIQRPNPLVAPGHLYSALAGGHFAHEGLRLHMAFDAVVEHATSRSVTGSFTQGTIDLHGGVETFPGQRFELNSHLVTTSGDQAAPPQRFGYIGGSGSLATVPLLSMGGDHLYFFDAAYVIPVPGVNLPLLGQPYLAPRFAGGAASVGGFGAPVQNVGVRAGASFISIDFLVNPRTHERDFGVGLAIPY